MKKENITIEHRNQDLYQILHIKPEATDTIQDSIDGAYEKIRNEKTVVHKNKLPRRRLMIGLAAAFLLAFGIFGFSNPVLAGKIPFIGRIFQLVEGKLSYPGNYSEHSVSLATEADINDEETDEQENAQNEISSDEAAHIEDDAANTLNNDAKAYSRTCGDVTITLSEASYSEMAIYLSMELYSKEGFPEDFDNVRNMEGYQSTYNSLYLRSRQSFDFSRADSSLYSTDTYDCSIEEGLPTPYHIEGTFADMHTFLGVIRIDLEAVREALQLEKLPPEFTYSIVIEKFWGKLEEAKEVEIGMEEAATIQERLKKYYEGPWSFTIPVVLDTENTQIKEIMDTNADGLGISKVTKTLYEIKAEILLPEGEQPYDYVVAITDEDGKLLEAQGNNAEIYSIYNRNTGTVHIYIVEYFTYMNECKGDNAYLLPQKALYQTTVTW